MTKHVHVIDNAHLGGQGRLESCKRSVAATFGISTLTAGLADAPRLPALNYSPLTPAFPGETSYSLTPRVQGGTYLHL
jgi:hypothetical protein